MKLFKCLLGTLMFLLLSNIIWGSVITNTDTQFYVPYWAQDGTYDTAFAIYNSLNSSNTIQYTLRDNNGNSIGTFQRTFAAGEALFWSARTYSFYGWTVVGSPQPPDVCTNWGTGSMIISSVSGPAVAFTMQEIIAWGSSGCIGDVGWNKFSVSISAIPSSIFSIPFGGLRSTARLLFPGLNNSTPQGSPFTTPCPCGSTAVPLYRASIRLTNFGSASVTVQFKWQKNNTGLQDHPNAPTDTLLPGQSKGYFLDDLFPYTPGTVGDGALRVLVTSGSSQLLGTMLEEDQAVLYFGYNSPGTIEFQ